MVGVEPTLHEILSMSSNKAKTDFDLFGLSVFAVDPCEVPGLL